MSAGIVCVIVGVAGDEPVRRLGPGDPLPPLRGEFLTGRAAELPGAAAGQVALAALGFTYGSRVAVEAWSTRFKREFDGQAGVTFFEVPMIGGMGRLARVFIDGGMRRGTPKALHEHVITVYGGTGDWKKRLGFRDPESAYLLLIDQHGVVRWTHAGRFDEGTFAELRDVAAGLLAQTGDVPSR